MTFPPRNKTQLVSWPPSASPEVRGLVLHCLPPVVQRCSGGIFRSGESRVRDAHCPPGSGGLRQPSKRQRLGLVLAERLSPVSGPLGWRTCCLSQMLCGNGMLVPPLLGPAAHRKSHFQKQQPRGVLSPGSFCL